MSGSPSRPVNGARLLRHFSVILPALLFAALLSLPTTAFAASAKGAPALAATPPMGWNDWAHYQCNFTAQTILDNARALVQTGLAAKGYDTVTIDDCWMQKNRDKNGDLQADPKRFPHGMKAVVDAVHGMGLKFGIYEDAGSTTCAGYAGSGQPQGGGKDHFFQDARLYRRWGVDYLKLDGCNLYVPKGETKEEAYRHAYAKESLALEAAGRPVVFSESAPAYFMGTPAWYDVLGWVGDYGQLWREGTDIRIFRKKNPNASRFGSVLWNYAYNQPLGRYQKPGNWNDADFIIGGDHGMTLAETRSQMALWSMMSAPLILSSNVSQLSPQALAILGNKAVIAVDQDPLGHMATLVRRSPKTDVLLKPLSGGDFAVAVLNHSAKPVRVRLKTRDLGFAEGAKCRFDAENLWTGKRQPSAPALSAKVVPHDTAIWRIQPSTACGAPQRAGAILMTVPGEHPHQIHKLEAYSLCLAASGKSEPCAGTQAERWTVTPKGELKSGGRCLTVAKGKPAMQTCAGANTDRWTYTQAGNLIGEAGKCLTASGSGNSPRPLTLAACGHNRADQIWSLPNPLP